MYSAAGGVSWSQLNVPIGEQSQSLGCTLPASVQGPEEGFAQTPISLRTGPCQRYSFALGFVSYPPSYTPCLGKGEPPMLTFLCLVGLWELCIEESLLPPCPTVWSPRLKQDGGRSAGFSFLELLLCGLCPCSELKVYHHFIQLVSGPFMCKIR